MAQIVYSGLQGHGKSYEVVRSVIVPAVSSGRRVVTNIAGLKIDKIKAYALRTLAKGKTFAQLGDIVQVQNEDVDKDNFFPVEKADNSDKIVQGGDLIILDECWRWYATGEQLPEGHLIFFRMHRHFLHPVTGQCCDIGLIVQAIDDLQRKIRNTVEKSFLMQKHKDLGMPNHYVVHAYSGKNQTPRTKIQEFQHKYNPEIFTLYSSYSQSSLSTGVEKSADNRGNIFSTPMVKYGIPVSVFMIGFAAWYGWGFFHKPIKSVNTAAVGQASKDPNSASTITASTLSAPAAPAVSSTWRLVGHYMRSSIMVFILQDASGRLRHITNPPGVKQTMGEYELILPDGEIVTQWSGVAPGQSKGPLL